VRSSLQFLLATAMAEQARRTSATRSRMLFLPDVLEPGLFADAIQRWTDPPFDQVVVVEPRRRIGQDVNTRSWREIRNDVVRALCDARPTVVTVFNDRQDPGQTVLIETARRFPQALRTCAEDGSLAYTNFSYRRHSPITRLRQRLRLGRHWADVQVLGTHPLVQQFDAIHPELLRAELRSGPVQPFPVQALGADSLRQLARSFCELVGFQPQSIGAGSVLITISHSSYARRNPSYLKQIQGCAARLQAGALPFYFKYHPRESETDYAGLGMHGSEREIPRTLPVECLYILARDTPLLVIGGMSTSLLTAGLLMRHVRSAALVDATSAGDAWDDRLLDALKITPLADEAALWRYLDGWRADAQT